MERVVEDVNNVSPVAGNYLNTLLDFVYGVITSYLWKLWFQIKMYSALAFVLGAGFLAFRAYQKQQRGSVVPGRGAEGKRLA